MALISAKKFETLSRAASYCLLLLFFINTVTHFFPFPAANLDRWHFVLTQIVERSTLPLVASIFLFAGLRSGSFLSRFELRLIATQKNLALLAALFYLLMAIALLPLATARNSALRSSFDNRLSAVGKSYEQLAGAVQKASSLQELQAVVQAQFPQADAQLPANSNLENVKAAFLSNLEGQRLIQRNQLVTELSGLTNSILLDAIRLLASSLVYAIYFLLYFIAFPARPSPALQVHAASASMTQSADE
jgi:hypothetical protein